MKYAVPILLLISASAFAQTTTQPELTETERLRLQVAALQQQVTELKAELAAAKGKPTPATKPAHFPLTKEDEIAKAIADHRVIPGMTVSQADKALGVSGSGPNDNRPYFQWIVPADPQKPGSKPTTYHAFVNSSNVITRVESR